jgi:hypothetical protein
MPGPTGTDRAVFSQRLGVCAGPVPDLDPGFQKNNLFLK